MSEADTVERLSRELASSAKKLSSGEARFLVDSYYQMQENRIRDNHQLRTLEERGEPSSVLGWLAKQSEVLEGQIKRALERYADSQPLGQWAMSNLGIGPVITAGLLAHIDITKAPTVGHIWAFAGLDPTKTWEKGQKRPWNATLKTLCWKIGESFVKVCNNPEAYYGQVYRRRKEFEQKQNDAGAYKEQAERTLQKRNYGKDTKAREFYLAGKLPPAHIHARAKRYAVKLFLSHFHDQAYRLHYGTEPPLPYAIAHGGHAHYLPPPNASQASQ
jgi:hypothetical protein